MPTPKQKKLKAVDIELAVVNHINPRQHLIIPNVHWGFNIHECDLLVVTKSHYLWEVEIKISRADILKDKQKKHCHNDYRIKEFYFAIPSYLKSCIPHIPDRAGIMLINTDKRLPKCLVYRKPQTNKSARKISLEERYQLARLGSLRIWGLKHKLNEIV